MTLMVAGGRFTMCAACGCFTVCVLQVLEGGLSAAGVPYSYGFAIILLTVLVKAATYPLSKKSVSGAGMQRYFTV
jgi:membrane protein insertase Oxa1/YidC/SpoIIIJ